MAGLEGDDFEKVLTAVRTVGEARDPDEFSRVVIEQVAALVPCDVVTFNEVDPVAARAVFISDPPSFNSSPDLVSSFELLAPEHPLITYFGRTGDGSAKKISDFWSQAQFRSSRLYAEVYKHLGVEYQIAVTLPAPRPIVVGIAVSRADTDFSERDRVVLNTVRPHFVQAWHNARDQRRLRALLDEAIQVGKPGGAGLVVLSDPPQELIPGSLVALYRYFGRPTHNSPLPARVERWLAAQRSPLEPDDELRLLKPLQSEGGGRRMVLRFLPVHGGDPGALLLQEERLSPRQQSLESLGLTAREAQIVSCVISGVTNAAIGQTLHVSPATVKKHLENIYTKLGVRGRGRLTAFVLDVVDR